MSYQRPEWTNRGYRRRGDLEPGQSLTPPELRIEELEKLIGGKQGEPCELCNIDIDHVVDVQMRSTQELRNAEIELMRFTNETANRLLRDLGVSEESEK